MGGADDQLNTGPLHRIDDGVAVGEAEGHRLFQDNVLTMLGRHDCVFGVELVLGRHIDGFHPVALAKLGHIGVGFRIIIAGEVGQQGFMVVRRGGHLGAVPALQPAQHDGAGQAKSGDTEA